MNIKDLEEEGMIYINTQNRDEWSFRNGQWELTKKGPELMPITRQDNERCSGLCCLFYENNCNQSRAQNDLPPFNLENK